MTKFVEWIKRLGRRNQLIVIIIFLLTINFFVIKNVTLGFAQDLAGQIKSPKEVEYSGLRTLFFGFPVISIFLGSILSLFVSKKKSYKARLINTSLIILIVFYTGMLILGIRNLILW